MIYFRPVRQWAVVCGVVAVMLLAGCGGPDLDQRTFRVSVRDRAHLLSARTEQRLRRRKLTGYDLAVRTRKSVPTARIVGVADDVFDALAKHDAFAKRGVLVLVTKRPRLVQVRVGKDVYLAAQRAGITFGPAYVAHQRAPSANADIALRRFMKWLVPHLPESRHGWRERLTNNVLYKPIIHEIGDLTQPSDGIYGKYLFAPILHVRLVELRLTNGFLLTFVLAGVVILLIRRLIDRALARLGRGGENPYVNGGVTVASIGLGAAVSVLLELPVIGTGLYASGSRREDQLALLHSHLPNVGALAFHPGLWNRQTTVLLALGVGLMRIVLGFARRAWLVGPARLPPERQQALYEELMDRDPVAAFLFLTSGTTTRGGTEIYDADQFLKEPYSAALLTPGLSDLAAGARWAGAAWLLLPEAVSVAALTLWAPAIAMGAVEAVKGWRWAQGRER